MTMKPPILKAIKNLDFIYDVTLPDQDLTGCEIVMKIRQNPNDSNIITQANILPVNLENGFFTIFLNSQQTAQLPHTSYFDILISKPSGERVLIAQGGIVKAYEYVSR
jgi:hypothetical protein